MLLNETSILGIALLALILDALIGDPKRLWTALPHPISLIGKVIDWADKRYNKPDQEAATKRERGFVFIVLMTGGALFLGRTIEIVILSFPLGGLFLAFIASIFIAQKSLFEHVREVARGLDRDGIFGGREAVKHIVGRNPETLDESGVARASIESCAENYSDGVVAPVFWFALFGFGGLLAYKAVNTADSMIGHKTERHISFGWAAAKWDDLLNWIPARIAGALVCGAAGLGGGKPEAAFKTMRADARKHRSPNAGWPEAAMAGALGIALAGPRTYQGEGTKNEPWINEPGRKNAHASDIRRSLKVFIGACGLHAGLIALFWILL